MISRHFTEEELLGLAANSTTVRKRSRCHLQRVQRNRSLTENLDELESSVKRKLIDSALYEKTAPFFSDSSVFHSFENPQTFQPSGFAPAEILWGRPSNQFEVTSRERLLPCTTIQEFSSHSNAAPPHVLYVSARCVGKVTRAFGAQAELGTSDEVGKSRLIALSTPSTEAPSGEEVYRQLPRFPSWVLEAECNAHVAEEAYSRVHEVEHELNSFPQCEAFDVGTNPTERGANSVANGGFSQWIKDEVEYSTSGHSARPLYCHRAGSAHFSNNAMVQTERQRSDNGHAQNNAAAKIFTIEEPRQETKLFRNVEIDGKNSTLHSNSVHSPRRLLTRMPDAIKLSNISPPKDDIISHHNSFEFAEPIGTP